MDRLQTQVRISKVSISATLLKKVQYAKVQLVHSQEIRSAGHVEQLNIKPGLTNTIKWAE